MSVLFLSGAASLDETFATKLTTKTKDTIRKRAFGEDITNKRAISKKRPLSECEFDPNEKSIESKKRKVDNRKQSDEKDIKKIDEKVHACDLNDQNNDLECVEYVNDIVGNLRKREKELSDFMCLQNEITCRMREILLDWLIEVHRKFRLRTPTLFLCVQLIDRYLESTQVIVKENLQLLGCVCLWIASKYHEIYAPEMSDFVFIADGAFTSADILCWEERVLNTLQFEIGRTNAYDFLERFRKTCIYRIPQLKHRKIVSEFMQYMLEMSLMDYTLSRCKPSLLAAGICAFSLNCFSSSFKWGNRNCIDTGYSIDELRDTILRLKELRLLVASRKKFRSIRKKFERTEHEKVALIKVHSVTLLETFNQ